MTSSFFRFYTFCLFFGAIVFFGCDKVKEEPPLIIGEGTKVEELLEVEPNLYFIGHGAEYGKDGFIIKFWKKGESKNLTNGNYYASARSIYVSGNDVYVAGIEGSPNGRIAKLWKNGTARNLANDAEVESVFVSGSDVYVAGSFRIDDYLCAALWINNEEPLTLGWGWFNTYANCVYVSGSDVYATGSIEGKTVLWENGVAQYLSEGAVAASANSIFVSGSNVYVAGYESKKVGEEIFHTVPMLWINREPHPLSIGGTSDYYGFISAMYVFVQGSDVYVTGYDVDARGKHIATLWKNGVAQKLIDDNSVESVAYRIFVKGDDVYILCDAWDDSGKGGSTILWKNGEVKTLLVDGQYSISDFFVVD